MENVLSQAFNNLLADRFAKLNEQNVTAKPSDAIINDSEQAFIQTLTDEQREVFDNLVSMYADQELDRCGTYFRIGFLDGLNAGKVMFE